LAPAVSVFPRDLLTQSRGDCRSSVSSRKPAVPSKCNKCWQRPNRSTKGEGETVAQVKVLGRGRRAPAVACSGSSAFADAAAHAVCVSQPPVVPPHVAKRRRPCRREANTESAERLRPAAAGRPKGQVVKDHITLGSLAAFATKRRAVFPAHVVQVGVVIVDVEEARGSLSHRNRRQWSRQGKGRGTVQRGGALMTAMGRRRYAGNLQLERRARLIACSM